MRDWLRDWPALAVACGLPVGQDGRPRVPSPSQRWKRAAAAGAPPFERLFVLAVREALRLRLIGARDLIIDSAPILAWRRQDPDAASGHAPAHPPPAAATGVIKRQPRPSWRYAALASSASASTWDRIQARWRRRRGAGTSRRPGCGANGDAPVPGARPPLGAMGTRRGRGVEPERVDNRRGSGHGRRAPTGHPSRLRRTVGVATVRYLALGPPGVAVTSVAGERISPARPPNRRSVPSPPTMATAAFRGEKGGGYGDRRRPCHATPPSTTLACLFRWHPIFATDDETRWWDSRARSNHQTALGRGWRRNGTMPRAARFVSAASGPSAEHSAPGEELPPRGDFARSG